MQERSDRDLDWDSSRRASAEKKWESILNVKLKDLLRDQLWAETEREKLKVTLSEVFWSQETERIESSLIGKKTREKAGLR